MFRITLLDPSGAPSVSRALSSVPIYVGRAASNDVVVASTAVSSRHAAFFTSGDKVFVEDLSSRNGTRVEGRRVLRPSEVCEGQEVVLGNVLRLRIERDEERERVALGWLVEDRCTTARVPVRGDRFRIAADAAADLCLPDLGEGDEVVLLVDPDGVVWRGDRDGELTALADGATFAAGHRELRLIAPPPGVSVTQEHGAARYRYRLEAELSGPTGPRALVSDPGGSARADFDGSSRAVLLWLLGRQRLEDREVGRPASDRGWCTDAVIASGLWGRAGEDRNLNVLVTRVRNDLRKAGLDPWFIEKRRGHVRVRLDDVVVRS